MEIPTDLKKMKNSSDKIDEFQIKEQIEKYGLTLISDFMSKNDDYQKDKIIQLFTTELNFFL